MLGACHFPVRNDWLTHEFTLPHVFSFALVGLLTLLPVLCGCSRVLLNCFKARCNRVRAQGDKVSEWPTCPAVMRCNVPNVESFIPLQGRRGHKELARQTQTERENEDKLVGGRAERIRDSERKDVWLGDTTTHTTHTEIHVRTLRNWCEATYLLKGGCVRQG